MTDVKMKFILHNGSASTIQSIHILENKRPEIKKVTKKILLKTHNRITYISNTVLIKLLVILFFMSFGAD